MIVIVSNVYKKLPQYRVERVLVVLLPDINYTYYRASIKNSHHNMCHQDLVEAYLL